MKLKDASYDALVEKHLHSHKQMTEEETKAEREEILGGAKSSFSDDVATINDQPIVRCEPIVEKLQAGVPISGGYITKSGRVMKGKPGRKLGSKLKPKEIK